MGPAVSVWFAHRALVAGHVVHSICGRKEEQMVTGWGPMCIRGTDV